MIHSHHCYQQAVIKLCIISAFVALPLKAADSGHSTRNFLMALWSNSTGTDADLPFFTEGQPQPEGNSILLLSSWQRHDFEQHWKTLVSEGYDVDRIQAIVIDEPYWSTLGTATWSNPCRDNRRAKLTQEL